MRAFREKEIEKEKMTKKFKHLRINEKFIEKND